MFGHINWKIKFDFLKSGTPMSPGRLNANQLVAIEATVQRDCGRDSIISYRWSISNYFDTSESI